jgi:hypothetical protein
MKYWSRIVILLVVGYAACYADRTPNAAPSPQALLMQVELEAAGGQYRSALDKARALIAGSPGTPQADSAARFLPRLEAEAAKQAAAARAVAESAAAVQRKQAARAAADEETRSLAEKWYYSRDVDAMTSKVSLYASITSENTVSFDFPYEGAQHGRLMIRDHPTHGRDVIFAIREGQLLCQSYEDCVIRVRFDESPAESWRAVGPADHSTTSIFLRNEERFVQRMRRARIVRVQVPVYQEGSPTFEFHVSGFNYERYRNGE